MLFDAKYEKLSENYFLRCKVISERINGQGAVETKLIYDRLHQLYAAMGDTEKKFHYLHLKNSK